MSKSVYNRHGFTLILLSLCLMIIVFLGITLSTVLNGNYVKKVVTSDSNVSLIKNYTNQKLGSVVDSYSPLKNMAATQLSTKQVKSIIDTSVDELYDGDPNLTIGSVVLATIGDNLKKQAKSDGLNIDTEVDQTVSSNKGIMDQIVNNDIGPIDESLQHIKEVKQLVKTVIIVASVIFILLAIRLRAKVGSNMIFLHHMGTVGIITAILLAIALVVMYYPIANLITSNVEYNIRDVLYNILNGIFTSYISIVFMVFIVSILDWGSTGKYKYN
ncbi:hypothetical protein [Companilactobacillus sp.]|jgi:hypothetical protein|uniref:hypothetical protein n=1 Tax=Companilactobacillus sp. TaxID=2767905 RepID=UPI0025BB9C22|nr:hypothetical protein [Companilactobacillus sp.]MCH4008998.1 hypothetical protein [Companilactobacillus sp.]MCH4050823.1 hypothetical protein [Companilactobacillus sp.]MCH4076941.1 hypothetical protein [Companilactobacillus sp.]MCH4125516.1 hypothetical protein [Companilactobacillus sp.]MCI1311225.1 hypothetical protein [Companilactobacillus sp.]